jgi:3,4-dihydroxy 2-butanone 4-phosphate synthase/GTP cyclohydrolase II
LKNMPVATIEEALNDLKQGKMIILVDDEDRENEGDLTMAAEKVTPEAINFMAKYGRGLICLSLAPEIVDRLKLPLMVYDNRSAFKTAFTVSVEARNGVTTGISAADRSHTILTAIADDAKPDDLVQPGHVFPIRARRGGVLFRTGQTEGSVDLARLAGLKPAGVICEVMKDDGTMARMPDLEGFSERHGLKLVTIADIIAYRMKTESFVHKAAETILPTPYGEFRAIAFVNDIDSYEHLALVKGDIQPDKEVLVRVHSQCLTGDVFGSFRCDCGAQLEKAMETVQAEGLGVVLYMQQEGRGIGLANKIRAYALQDKGRDTVEANKELGFEADMRDYGVGAQILAALGVKKMRLMTNNPRKIIGLEGYGLEVTGRVPLETVPRPENLKYLVTKCQKLGHLLNLRKEGAPQTDQPYEKGRGMGGEGV